MDEYLAGLPEDIRDALQSLRQTIRAAVPEAEERISYRIPVFKLGRDLVGIASQANHCSFYTMSPPLVKAMETELQDFEVSGATIHFTPDKPLPSALVKKILTARVKELSRPSQ